MRIAAVAVITLIILGCRSPTPATESAAPIASAPTPFDRTGEARVPVTPAPEFSAGPRWVRLPVTVAPATFVPGLCGQAPSLKVASRMEPPARTLNGMWRFDGCLASPGNIFTDITLELVFPDGTRIVRRIAERMGPDQELRYTVTVARDEVSKVEARLFVNEP
jgi:hypothetical protein